ncbi:MAG: E3 binding domain-containing protein, partial [Candidatus Nanohaloarchaea archaeon]
MAVEFEFPDVGEGVTEGTLIQWLVEEGDAVEEDESLAEVETDKAVVEVPSPTDGTIQELRAAEGDTIAVGDVIVVIAEDGDGEAAADQEEAEEETAEEQEDEAEAEGAAGDAGEGGGAETEGAAEQDGQAGGGSTSVVGDLEDADEAAEDTGEGDAASSDAAAKADDGATDTGGKVLAAPSTRKLAREEGVDITAVEGSGPGGRVTRQDVKQAASSESGDESGGEEPGGGGKILATPSVRNLAREEGVDLSQVEGSGPGGRITEEDVRAAMEGEETGGGEAAEEGEAAAAAPSATFGSSGRRFAPKEYDFTQWGEVERQELSSTRKSIAKQMERSAYTAPHVTATDDADVTELVRVREKEKQHAEEDGIHLTFLPFVMKAVISALRDYPRLNASLDETTGELVLKDYYNIGVAVATDDGL